MNSKKQNVIIVIVLVLAILLISNTCIYAFVNDRENGKEKLFFEISKTEYSKNEKVEMTINLDVIKYDVFKFELTSSENMQNVELASSGDDENIEVENNGNEISIEIDKDVTNLETINLYYQIPEYVQINDTVQFTATITNLKESNTDDKEVDIYKEVNIYEEETPSLEPEMQTVILEIKVIEQKEENNQNNTGYNMQKPSNNNSASQIKNNSLTTTQTVKYNGSDNNYLAKLSVTGYELNRNFSKDCSTYFIEVDENVTSLKIKTTLDNDNSLVNVYGNENIVQGMNKILISVTAENGNVRTYRIYVTKK